MKHPLVHECIGALFLLALGMMALLALSYVPYTNPVSITLASVRPFIAIGLGLFGILFCLLLRWVRGSVMILMAGLCLGQVWFSTAGLRAQPIEDPGQTIKLISFNLLWERPQRGGAIADYLIAEKPDIAFIQEAGPLQAHLNRLLDTFPYRIGCGELTERCDLMFLSRHPLDDRQIGNLSDAGYQRLFTAKADIVGTPVNIIAPHLTKPYYETHQYWEFRKLTETAQRMEGPILMAGDFNSAAWAPDFLAMLENTGLRLPPKEPGTWPVMLGDWGIPIDHVLAREPASIVSVRALPHAFGSNHRGLMAEIQLAAHN